MYHLKMRTRGITTLGVVTVACVLLLGAMSGPAEAGVCSKVGSSDGCVTPKDVKDDSLLDRDLQDEAGADFVAPGRVALTGAVQTIASVQVTAPRSGVVIANASGWFNMGANGTSVECGLSLDATLPTTPKIFEDNTPGGQGDEDEVFALTRGFNVGKGTITVNLVCDGNNAASVEDVALTAMYFPTRY